MKINNYLTYKSDLLSLFKVFPLPSIVYEFRVKFNCFLIRFGCFIGLI